MKTILIMRHGEAAPMQADDAARNLTQVGHLEAKKMGAVACQYAKTGCIVS